MGNVTGFLRETQRIKESKDFVVIDETFLIAIKGMVSAENDKKK